MPADGYAGVDHRTLTRSPGRAAARRLRPTISLGERPSTDPSDLPATGERIVMRRPFAVRVHVTRSGTGPRALRGPVPLLSLIHI